MVLTVPDPAIAPLVLSIFCHLLAGASAKITQSPAAQELGRFGDPFGYAVPPSDTIY